MERGFIKLHRKIDKWEWYDHPNTFRLFIHCLIKANHKTKKWRGNTIKRGQFITSYAKLSSELNMSVQQVRTGLKNLISTGELTHQNNSQNGIITIVAYDVYQPVNTPVNTQATHKQHTSNNNEEALISYNKITFCPETKKIINISEEEKEKWRKKYKVDIQIEIEKAENWLNINNKRKKDYKKFLENWFNNKIKNEKKVVNTKEDIKEIALKFIKYKTEINTNYNSSTKQEYRNLIKKLPYYEILEKIKPKKSFEFMNDFENNMFIKEAKKNIGG